MSSCTSARVANTLAGIFTWTGFGLTIAAIAGKRWVFVSSAYSGLWQTCTTSGSSETCVNFTSVEAWLNAVRAFAIMSVVLSNIGVTTYTIGYWKLKKKAADAGFGLIYLSAMFATIAAAVYTGYMSSTVRDSSGTWGYCFAFAWAAVGCLNIGGGAAHASVVLQYKDDDAL